MNEGKNISKKFRENDKLGCQGECQGKLKRVTYKFKGCSETFYRCVDCKQKFVEVWDKFCSKPVYISFNL